MLHGQPVEAVVLQALIWANMKRGVVQTGQKQITSNLLLTSAHDEQKEGALTYHASDNAESISTETLALMVLYCE